MRLSNIEYEYGSIYPIDNVLINPQEQEKKNIHFLKEFGISFYSKLEEEEYDILYRCMKKTLNNSELIVSDIRKVIFVTSSLDAYSSRKFVFNKLLVDLNLNFAIPVGVFLNRCNNFISALRIAKSIIEGEEIKHVLIVCYDWTTFSSKTPQVMESNSSFLSDAVISCIVSNKNTPSVNNTGTYKVVDFETSSNHTLYDKRIVNYVQGIKISADSIKKVSKTLFLRNNLNSTDFKCFIAGNFNTMLKKNYAFISGFKKEQVYENDSLMGHSFSTDQLIALKNICTDVSGVEHGEYLYVLWSGDYFWGGLILRKV